MGPMSSENGGDLGGAGSANVALYISTLADELARLARGHDFEALAYILDMARMEAEQICKQWGSAPDHQAACGPD